MKEMLTRFEALLVVISITMASVSCGSKEQASTSNTPSNTTASSTDNSAPVDGDASQAVKFTDEELDQLLAPVALYPDPLLAQIIPASTFVEDIKDAQETLNGNTDDNVIAKEDWDVSVKSVAHYPKVLKMMADDLDWTTTLGQAYINQPADITKSIQRLRTDASDAGNLFTTPQQEVIEKDNIIQIEPAQEKTIYVPEYNAETVYVEEAPQDDGGGVSTGGAVAIAALSFGAGMLIGSWLNRDYDYGGYYGQPGVYYHGWNTGPSWVTANRRYVDVDVNRNIYVNDSYRNINVNRAVVNRNVRTYRGDLTKNAVVRNQRVTNARVNRQLNRTNHPGQGVGHGVQRHREGDLGRPGPDGPRGQNVGGGGDRINRGQNLDGDRNNGVRQNSELKNTSRDSSRQNTPKRSATTTAKPNRQGKGAAQGRRPR